MSNSANRAKSLLAHYMRLIAKESGVRWDSENDTEVQEIVDLIVEAAAEEAAKRVMRLLPPSIQE